MLSVFVLQEKLNSSSSRIEISLGKKLTRDMLPEIEKEHKVPICSLFFLFISVFTLVTLLLNSHLA